MKETSTQSTITASDIVDGAVYFNSKNELVQVKKIDNEKKVVHFFNISEQYTVYLRFERINLIKRVR